MTTSNRPKIIGISGSFASGQDTLAEYLKTDFGYLWFSTSDMVRKVSQERYGSIERPMLFRTATELRKERGGGVLVEIGIEEYQKSHNDVGIVLSGIRSMGEMNAVLDAGGVMVYVDADPEIRYQRMVSRRRDQESQLTKEEFLDREQAEWHVGDNDADFNKRDIRAYAESKDMIILNDSDLQAYLGGARQKLGLE